VDPEHALTVAEPAAGGGTLHWPHVPVNHGSNVLLLR
jgi:hypothetical protein